MPTSRALHRSVRTTPHLPVEEVVADDAFVVLDVENLLFPYFTEVVDHAGRREVAPDAIARFTNIVARLAGQTRRIIAIGDRRLLPHLIPVAAAHGVRLVPTHPGPDSADLECIHRLLLDLPAGCREVVIGSGDGLFSLPARWLVGRGLRVSVLPPDNTHRRSAKLSRALATSASRVLSTPVQAAL